MSHGVELPERLKAHVGTAGPLVHGVVGADGEHTPLDQLVGRLKAVDQDLRRERAHLFPADCVRRRLDQRCPRGELGAVGQGDRHQVVVRPVGIDQGDLEVIVLERDDHRTRVEPEDLGEIRTLDAPCFPRRGGLLLEVGDEVPGPIDLDLGDQLLAQLRDPLDQIVPSLDGVERAGIHSPILVHLEIDIGGHRHASRSWRSGCRLAMELRFCRATRGWKRTSVVATFWIRPPPP